MKKYVITLIISLLNIPFSFAQIGSWKAYMAYSDVQQIVKAGDHLFVRASNSLYQYNLTDHSITTYDKITRLSDSYINHIAWNQQAKRLIIVYQNSNIDLMDQSGNVTNISAIYRKAMTEDKTIDSLTVDGIYAYLYARFGIVKVNMQRAEISDTYTKNHPEYPTNLPASNINANWAEYIDVVKTLKPGGPVYNHFNYMLFTDRLYTTGGGWRDGGEFSRPGCAQILASDGEWEIFHNVKPLMGSTFLDATCIAKDPKNSQHYFVATCGTGLYEFLNGEMVMNYTEGNSPLKSSIVGNNDYVRVDGLIFDTEGKLWMSCSSRSSEKNTLLTLDIDTKEWTTYNDNELYYNDTRLKILRYPLIDDSGFLWMANDHHEHPCLLRINTSTGKINRYDTFTNQDGTPYSINYIRGICQDKEGNIWIGTDVGLFMYNKEQQADPTKGFTQIKVPRNDGTDYADYLMTGINISTIIIDGANRKWIGTDGNGVYLISADNMEQLQHFTTDNSMLISDNIESIAINNNTGEVFFGTAYGLCSYSSDATTPTDDMSSDDVYAYPNPVTPDYTGLITIRGLSYDADVKILSSSGKLIAEGRSNGGTFTWNGCNKDGKRVASGVYMVVTAKSDGNKGTVCKIAIIR